MFRSVQAGNISFADVVVIGKFEDMELSNHEHPAAQVASRRADFRGKIGEWAEAYPDDNSPRILIIGLGERNALTLDAFRKAAAAACRRISATRADQVELRIGGLADPAMMGRAFGEAAGYLAWPPSDFRGSGSDEDERRDLTLYPHEEEFRHGLEYGLALAQSANLARRLVFTPPSIATPLWMAEQARKLAEETGLIVEVIEGDRLAEENLNGLINVGQASCHPPCMIRLEYQPENSVEQKPVVLVGKTITYDTGGLTLKTKTGMPGMKGDKAGGCAVLGAMHAVATLIKPPFPVVALLPAAENSVSSNAYRPDDVITYRNGVTVEVTNTDAEGRLVLADALCWAFHKEDPAFVVDIATLTGGVVTALGNVFAGTFCSDEALWADLTEASAVSGEKLWRMPLHAEYRGLMKSEIADLVNSNLNGLAHPVQGATFLSYFVPDEAKWAHIDIAGTAGTRADKDMFVPGPTGFGVRLFADLLRDRVSSEPGT